MANHFVTGSRVPFMEVTHPNDATRCHEEPYTTSNPIQDHVGNLLEKTFPLELLLAALLPLPMLLTLIQGYEQRAILRETSGSPNVMPPG